MDLMNASLPGGGSRPLLDNPEYGVSGTENYAGVIRHEDYNPDFDNFQKAVQLFEKMRRSDAAIRSIMQVLKLPLLSATWLAVPPENGDQIDQQIADFVNTNLFDDDAMLDSWNYVLRHILLQLDFGFSVSELVWRADESGYFKLKRLAPRLPKTIREWHVNRDGSLRAVVQYAAVPLPQTLPAQGKSRVPVYRTSASFQYLTLPADYLAVFVLDREGDNYEGSPLLRNVYRNWWYKDQAYRLIGVGLDRWAVGIPIAELDPENTMSQRDLDKLQEVLRSFRAHEQAYAVSPPYVHYKILPENNRGDVPQMMEWVDHHDTQMQMSILANFMSMGQKGRGSLGSGGLSATSRMADMFISSLHGIAKGIGGDLKTQVVRKMCEYNFDMTKRQAPSILCRDLESVDLENLVAVLAKLAGTVITPDDDMESMLRKMLKLPPLKESMSRKARSEASPGSAAEAANVQKAQDAAPAAAQHAGGIMDQQQSQDPNAGSFTPDN